MNALSRFRDHCASMATANHRPDCPHIIASKPYWSSWALSEDGHSLHWRGLEPPWAPPACDGCVTDADREIWARLAAEVDAYQAPQVDLFGDLIDEPPTNEETT